MSKKAQIWPFLTKVTLQKRPRMPRKFIKFKKHAIFDLFLTFFHFFIKFIKIIGFNLRISVISPKDLGSIIEVYKVLKSNKFVKL